METRGLGKFGLSLFMFWTGFLGLIVFLAWSCSPEPAPVVGTSINGASLTECKECKDYGFSRCVGTATVGTPAHDRCVLLVTYGCLCNKDDVLDPACQTCAASNPWGPPIVDALAYFDYMYTCMCTP